MLLNERELRNEHVIECAKQMMTAARTAPKAKGVDIIEVMLVTGDDIIALSDALHKMGEEMGRGGLMRDADNLHSAEAVVLIGSREEAMCLNCGYCGYDRCDKKPDYTPCVMNGVDVGIAIGSACSKIADLRLDSRVLFSAGWAAKRLDILDGAGLVFAIPVTAASKNPFFDRKSPVNR